MTELSGTIEMDGQTVKWDRMSSLGLAIEFDQGTRLHIGGEPSEDRILLAMKSYRQGWWEGVSTGRAQMQNEFKKLLGI